MVSDRNALSRYAPPEIILEILKSCETFEQLRALILTSSHIHLVWVAHHRIIIWHVAPKVIPAFDPALMAVCTH